MGSAKYEVEVSDDLNPQAVMDALAGTVAALSAGGYVLVLPVPADFPVDQMPQVAAFFVQHLRAQKPVSPGGVSSAWAPSD